MKPAPFEYVRPASLEEAIAALTEGGYAARALAGGQSLIPAMNFRLAQPSLLVDLCDLTTLRGIEGVGDEEGGGPGDGGGDGGLRIGAMTRQRAVERSALVGQRAPLLAEAMPWVAHPQIRNRGTIGGSLAHADPAAELPAVMMVLDATFALRGAYGSRLVPARDFYLGLFSTALEPGELVVEIRIPARAARSRCAFEEVSRRHGDFALAGVAAELEFGEDGAVERAAIGLFSVGDAPILSGDGAACLAGRTLTDSVIGEAAEATAAALDPPGDIHASPAFRRHLARVLTRRALERIRERAPD